MSRTTSSATAAIRGWRSCASCGAETRTNASSASRACSPVAARGEIVDAHRPPGRETKLRGGLTLSSSGPLGVEKAREFYEQETGGAVAV